MSLLSLMFNLLRRYVLEFEKCLDKTEPVPWEVIRGRMRNELGRPLEDVFSSVDPVPLASASIAQVHAAGEEQAGTCLYFSIFQALDVPGCQMYNNPRVTARMYRYERYGDFAC